jgi:uncharacterized membrane protein
MSSRKHIHQHASIGGMIAEKVAKGMGSWRFIIIQTLVLATWALLNSVAWWIWKWDAYPFIAMNLLLSCQAAYAAPLIMMAQNRQDEKDRKRDDHESVEVDEITVLTKAIHVIAQQIHDVVVQQTAILEQQNGILDVLHKQAPTIEHLQTLMESEVLKYGDTLTSIMEKLESHEDMLKALTIRGRSKVHD